MNNGTPMQNGSPKQASLRKATAADVPVLAAALARAFADDPLPDWLCGPRGEEADELRNARTAALFSGYLHCLALRHELTFTTPSLQGGALWSPPGGWKMGLISQLQMTPYFIRTTGWRRLPTRFIGAETVLAAHPAEPHYYLQVLGVDPAGQGQGWGSQLLRRGLAIADEARKPSFLETMTEENVVFYQRHGFRVTREIRVPFTGHRIWHMWRDVPGDTSP